MEERLRNLEIIGPGPNLRARILEAALAEMAERDSIVERVWRSRAFWLGAAASVLLAVTVTWLTDALRLPGGARPLPPPDGLAQAEEFAAEAGDGQALRDALVRAASAPVPCAYDPGQSLEELL